MRPTRSAAHWDSMSSVSSIVLVLHLYCSAHRTGQSLFFPLRASVLIFPYTEHWYHTLPSNCFSQFHLAVQLPHSIASRRSLVYERPRSPTGQVSRFTPCMPTVSTRSLGLVSEMSCREDRLPVSHMNLENYNLGVTLFLRYRLTLLKELGPGAARNRPRIRSKQQCT